MFPSIKSEDRGRGQDGGVYSTLMVSVLVEASGRTGGALGLNLSWTLSGVLVG